jgi:hypothetical protein
MYNSGNSSKNVTGASVVDGTLASADYADNGLSGDKIDGGIISNFQSTGIDDRLPTGKVLTLSTTGADVNGEVQADTFVLADSNNTDRWELIRSGNDFTIYNDYPSQSEKVRILSSGGISFNGDTAAANALDDYEEGTWTPEFISHSSVTYTTQDGHYTKVGDTVYVYGNLSWTSFVASGALRLGGLPFNPTNTFNFPNQLHIGIDTNNTIYGTIQQYYTDDRFFFYDRLGNANANPFGASGTIRFSGHYKVTD